MRVRRCGFIWLGLETNETELAAHETPADPQVAKSVRPRDSNETLLGAKFNPQERINASGNQALNFHGAPEVMSVDERDLANGWQSDGLRQLERDCALSERRSRSETKGCKSQWQQAL
jgi:hypothetical protein